MWYKIKDQQIILNILAKPNAKRTAILGVRDQALHISVHAKPHQGEANQELISYLAKLLKLPKSKITLERGEGSRHKKISVPLSERVKEWISSCVKTGVVEQCHKNH